MEPLAALWKTRLRPFLKHISYLLHSFARPFRTMNEYVLHDFHLTPSRVRPITTTGVHYFQIQGRMSSKSRPERVTVHGTLQFSRAVHRLLTPSSEKVAVNLEGCQ
jgi:hypothetical protein